jgi:putative Mg2+ transporter-C (MgtC) family protein
MPEFAVDSIRFQLEALGQILIAMFLGAMIGFNREYSRKPAGLRTHMLVSGAAAMIVILAKISIIHFGEYVGVESLRFDPVRIFVAVVTGISFLGAGTIIRQGDSSRVEGLTTAASLLFSAVIGMGVALSQYILAIGLSLIAVLILWVLAKIERRLKHE